MSEEPRPDPESLLELANAAETNRGRLKIFLGMCPGVGKTYAMLLAAQQLQEEGVDVVIGTIETHGRIETQALTAGLARIPLRKIVHRGSTLSEMDLDAILARRPQLVLVDELAHSNIAGSRHLKRYQNVLELLEAGIDVFTTLNVQHIESQRDVVTQITGAPVHERVPDSIVDRADEIELVDLSPEQLRKRLEEGKVYLGERAVAASDNFFREGNLRALREIALRITAEQADKELRSFMHRRRISGPWRSREHLLVAIGPSPYSEHLIRWTRRIATLSHATWMAVYIDTGRPLNDQERTRMEKNLTLARTLGAEVHATSGGEVSQTLLRFAREHNISQIVVGKPLTNPVLDFLRGGSLVDRLIRRSGEIDIYVVRAEKAAPPWRPDLGGLAEPRLWREFGQGVLLVLGTTIAGLLLRSAIGYMAVGLLYLLAVLLSSIFLSRWPILLTATLTAVAWDFLFITPYYTFRISNIHDVILFGMYFVVALVLGHLNARLRQREQTERRREEQAVALYRFSRDVAVSLSLDAAAREGVRQIDELFSVTTTVLAKGDSEKLETLSGAALSEREMAVASWAFEKKEPAGRFTNTLSQAEGFYLPLHTGHQVAGVLGLRARAPLTLSERQLLETFATQLALLIERERFRQHAESAKIAEKSRQLQKTLLDSVSHEFKTPLAVIATALESLRSHPAHPESLLAEIRIASERLQRIVTNLLDITRIETGAVLPRLAWCDLREIVDRAVQRATEDTTAIQVDIAEAVSACEVDSGLLEEMLANLLRNALQNSPNGSSIFIRAGPKDGGVQIDVCDEGPGIPPEDATRLFEKFQRGKNAKPGGLGLGLSIVKGFAEAQGGTIAVIHRTDGKLGAQFQIFLPVASRSMQTIATTA